MLDDIIKAQKDTRQRGRFAIWVVYDHPRDYPNTFVARRFEVGKELKLVATEDVIRDTKIYVLRACLRCAGLNVFPRKAEDDPRIMETWL